VMFQLCHTSHPSFVAPPLPSLSLSEVRTMVATKTSRN
jgi:hypothetical protein